MQTVLHSVCMFIHLVYLQDIYTYIYIYILTQLLLDCSLNTGFTYISSDMFRLMQVSHLQACF
jgi:hypothetical protein